MGDKKEVSNRFIEAYERLLSDGLVTSKKEFASIVGISPSMVTEISKGRSSVGTSAIQNIVLLYDVSGDWLLTGEGSMFQSSPPASEPRIVATDEESYEAAKRQGVEMIPEYDVEFHGGDGIVPTNEPIQAMWSVPNVPRDAYVITLTGDSMSPLIKSGTKIVVAPRSLVSSALELPFGEIYAIAVRDEEGYTHTHVKFIRRHPDPTKEHTHWIARSANHENYDDFEIPVASVHLLGRVIMSVNFL
ncbi:MAG: S24 family peptidase [Prevotellaceae bacterium]|nr:S24 family peptidase [Prevotellaceae bacterium]